MFRLGFKLGLDTILAKRAVCHASDMIVCGIRIASQAQLSNRFVAVLTHIIVHCCVLRLRALSTP